MNAIEIQTKKAVVYCRVSSRDQEETGFSLPSQEKFLKEDAEKKNLKIAKSFSISESASGKTQRGVFKEMMDYAKRNKIKVIICEKVDRLTRNFKDAVLIDDWLEEDEERQVHLVKDAIILHKNSRSQEKFNWGIRVIMAKNHIDNLSEEVKKGLKEKFEQGQWPGWAPLGYFNQEVNNQKIIVPDPERWSLIKEGLRMYLTGNYSAIEISDILYEKGLRSKTEKKVCNSIMINTIANPFYAGLMRWNKQEKMGNHEPMITLEEHRQILSIKEAHGQNGCRRSKHDFLLRGFVFCDICGQKYTAEKHRIGKNPDYYHCSAKVTKHSNKGQNIEVEELEKQVEERFQTIELDKDFINLVVQKVKKFYQNQKEEKVHQKRILLNRKMKIEHDKEVAIKNILTLEGVVPQNDFKTTIDQFVKEIGVTQNQLDKLETKYETDIDVLREVLMLARNVYQAYKKAPYEIKRHYLSFFWDGFWAKDGKIVRAEPTKLIKILQNERRIIIRSDLLPR